MVRLMTVALALPLVLPLSLLGPPAQAASGAVWVPTLTTTEDYERLSVFPNGVAYAQTGGNYASSQDFGLTWVRRAQPGDPVNVAPSTGQGSNIVRFATPDVGYAKVSGSSFAVAGCGVTQFTRTTDGGAHWTPFCPPADAAAHHTVWAVSSISVGPNATTVMLTGTEHEDVLGTTCDDLRGVAYTSNDGGATWTRGLMPANSFPGWVTDVVDSTHAAVVAYHHIDGTGCDPRNDSNGVVVTSDGGVTWTAALECPNTGPLCTSVGLVTASRMLVGRADGSMAQSDDGGTTFGVAQKLTDLRVQVIVARDPTTTNVFWVQSFAFADATHGYASTRGVGTWRTDDGGHTWVQEASHECGYSPVGVSEIAVATVDRALVGGGDAVSPRVPALAGTGRCTASLLHLNARTPVISTPVGTIYADASVDLHFGIPGE